MRKNFIVLILSLLIFECYATEHNFSFRHITVANGLSSNRVRAITQDKYGIIWFGSDEGLDSYYGTHIKPFRLLNDHTPNPAVMSLLSTDTTLWVGTENGLYSFNYSTEQFQPFTLPTSNGTHIRTTVCHLAIDTNGAIWIATMGQGVFCYENNILTQYSNRGENDYKVHITVDKEGNVWTLSNWSSNDGIYKLDRKKNRFEKFSLHQPNQQPYEAYGLALLEDSDHAMWLGTFNDGLIRFDGETGEIIHHLTTSTEHKFTHIHSLLEYAPHQIMIGSDDGLAIYNTQSGTFRLYTDDEPSKNCISSRFIYPIIRDVEGGIWIGTFYNGVNYISPRSDYFECFTSSKYKNSISGNVVSRMCEDERNNIYIATDDGGLSCFNPQTRHFSHIPTTSNNVHALCLDNEELWVGTYTGGIDVINTKTSQHRNYSIIKAPNANEVETSCYSLLKDNNGIMWIGTMSNIFCYDKATDSFRHIRNVESLIIDIDQDVDGNIWFSTQSRGLFKYTPQTGSWTNYRTDNNYNTLSHNQVNNLCIDDYNNIYVATVAGLSKYNRANNSFDTIDLDLPNNNICSVVADHHTLWLSTNNGLAVYRLNDSKKLSIFTSHDGLMSDQYTPNAMFKSHSGRLYAGSVNGFCAFYPSQIKENKHKPTVIFTELKIFNKPILVGSAQMPQSLITHPQIALTYAENVFSIQYSSLSYCTIENNQYAYFLEGFDNEWNYVGNQNEVTYTNLPPNTYTLHVRATNNDSVWCNDEATLKIIITPPFYWNLPAQIIYSISLLLLIILIVRIALHRSELRHTEHLRELESQRERMVHEAKIKFFTMVTHEIRTPLSLIIGPLEQVLKNASQLPNTIKENLQITYRNTQRLLTLVNQLLDFRKAEEISTYHMQRTNIKKLLQSVVERFQPIMKQHGHTFNVNYPSSDSEIVVDAESVTKLVSNLLVNANKYAHNNISLNCTIDIDNMIISVTDDGQGVPENEQKKIFEIFYQGNENKPGTGIGLSIVKSVAEAHQGEVTIKSQEGEGTTFCVRIPTNLPASTENATQFIAPATLPIADLEQSQTEQTPNDNSTDETKRQLLLVDDNAEMLQFVKNGLADRYTILTAENGKQALDMLSTHNIDFVVSDWMMPIMDGRDLCLNIRKNLNISHLPFILLTAKTDIDSKIEGMYCGADCYIEKPFSIDYLRACINNLIELRRMLYEKYSTQLMAPISIIANNQNDSAFLTKMNEIIESHIAESEFSVQDLAQEMCISRSGLFSKIKSLTDTTPNELIQTARLKRAATLLRTTNYTVSEISIMVGFNSSSYFSKCFSKHFGQKPMEYK